MATYIFALIEDEDEGIVEQDLEDHDAAMAFARSQLGEHGDQSGMPCRWQNTSIHGSLGLWPLAQISVA
jgi:hypothetical protein